MYGYYNGYPVHMFGFSIIGIVLMVLFWVFIISLLFRLFRGPHHWRSHRWDRWDERGGMRDTALDILKERYAKGELTKEQFEGMKRDIA